MWFAVERLELYNLYLCDGVSNISEIDKGTDCNHAIYYPLTTLVLTKFGCWHSINYNGFATILSIWKMTSTIVGFTPYQLLFVAAIILCIINDE
jgi:hypothetical protein